MTTEQLQTLKADYLEWTGGFEPETSDDIATYVETSMPLELEKDEATDALREWMMATSQ